MVMDLTEASDVCSISVTLNGSIGFPDDPVILWTTLSDALLDNQGSQ